MRTLKEHLVLSYKMNEIKNGTVKDESGNQNHGIVHGELVSHHDGVRAGIQFEGKDEQYIEVPSHVLSTCEELTIMCFVMPTQLKMWQRVFDFGPEMDKNIFLTLEGGANTPMLSLHHKDLNRFGVPQKLEENKWQHLTITVKNNEASIYIDGRLEAHSQTITVKPNDMTGDPVLNYIGKSRHADPLFVGEMAEFKLFNKALTAEEIIENVLEEATELQICEFAKSQLSLGDCSLVTTNISLPTHLNKASISWLSCDENVISNTGVVNRQQDDCVVTLTANISYKGSSIEQEFKVNVLGSHAVPVTIEVHPQSKGVKIPKTFVGLFFEDINYAADGGLYAELINNRSFEFGSFSDTYSSFNDYFYSWSIVGDIEGILTHKLENTAPIHENNPNYLQVKVEHAGNGVGIANHGFEGIAVKKDETYLCSIFVQNVDYTGNIHICLESNEGDVYAVECIHQASLNNTWTKHEVNLTSSATDEFARLSVIFDQEGTVELDMISLFPEKTFNGRVNGMREDLAQMLKDINPGFIRFPGGCIVEGMVLDNAYNWKHTVGPVETRKMNWNRWEGGQAYPYNQSYGLGFLEYFILAKDLGAEPLPIVNCGMSCQFQGAQLAPDFEPYIQDALDLIEFANGDETTVWGQKRIEYGHKEPFNLKYLGVGNEQWIDKVKHGEMDCLKIYEIFRNRIKAVYPDINLITTSGPFPYGKEFDDAYDVITPKIVEYIAKGEVYTEIIDEHFYMSPEWFLENMHRYDEYPRYEDGLSGKIFLGEYACHTNRNGFSSQGVNNMLAALCEAAFLTSAERNADVIEMTTYAPLFAKKNRTQWGPDLIWFDNTKAYGTPSYYVQKMYGLNMGDYTLETNVVTHPTTVNKTSQPLYTIASFDEATNEVIIKIVNLNETVKEVQISLKDVELASNNVKVTSLCAKNSLEDVNTFENPTHIEDVSSSMTVESSSFNYTINPNSFDVLRLTVK